MSRVLVFVPTSPVTPKIYGRSLTSIMRLEWSGKMEQVFARHDGTALHKYDDLVEKHNRARDLALDGGHDAVLFVENDVIVPPDALAKLYEVDADVAYGLYVNRHGFHRWLAFFHVDGLHGGSFSQSPELMREVWGKPYTTSGVGMGCTLVRRNVLEAVRFRAHERHEVADDWMFSLDLMAGGFSQAHHFGVVCGHIKNPNETLWPDPEAEGGYAVEFSGEPRGARVHEFTVGMETLVVHGRVTNGEGDNRDGVPG